MDALIHFKSPWGEAGWSKSPPAVVVLCPGALAGALVAGQQCCWIFSPRAVVHILSIP